MLWQEVVAAEVAAAVQEAAEAVAVREAEEATQEEHQEPVFPAL